MRIGLELPPQWRVFGAFFIYSFAMGGFFPRLADIQQQLGVAEGALGLALIGAPLGTLISLTLAGRVLDRIGYRRTLVMLLPLIAIVYATATFAVTPVMLFLILFPAGLFIGATEIIINVEADRTEHKIGRRIMNRAHAFWSFGFFTAGMAGAIAKQIGLTPVEQMWLSAPVVIVATILVLGRFDPAPMRNTSEGSAPTFAMPTAAIGLLVALTLSAMLLEGANIDWSAIYMRDTFASPPFLVGFAVAVGAGAQTLARFFADQVVERFGVARVVRVLVILLGAGALVVTFSPHMYLSLVGFALIGLGSSAIFPLAVSAAAQRTDRPAAINVASLAQTSFMVFFVGPPLLGFVAEHFGIRTSFGVTLPLVVLSWFTMQALNPKTTTDDDAD